MVTRHAHTQHVLNGAWYRPGPRLLATAPTWLSLATEEERAARERGVEFHMEGLEGYLPKGLEVGGGVLAGYEAACAEFKTFLSHINEVKKVFPLDGACSEHVMLLQDVSKAYRHLAALSGKPDDVCKMYKRRIDSLEPVALQLNPAAFDAQCKEIWYEVAEAYRDMFDVKVAQVEQGAKKIGPDKLQALADGSINAYQHYLKCFLPVPNDPETSDKNQPQGLGDARIRRWYLTARFGLARILSKRPGNDLNERRKYLAQALDEYKRIVELGEQMPFQPKDEVNFEQEIEMCREMVSLLPAKIHRLHTLHPGLSGTA